MKTRLIKTLIALALILGAWRLGQAQVQVAQFHFTIQRTESGVKMQCQQGCAWKDLSFSLSEDRAQAVDGMGMVEK